MCDSKHAERVLGKLQMIFRRIDEIPEHELLIAMIMRSILDIMEPTAGLPQREIRSAKFWLISEEEKEPFSFLWCLKHICDNPHIIAKQIRSSVFLKLIKPAKHKRRGKSR